MESNKHTHKQINVADSYLGCYGDVNVMVFTFLNQIEGIKVFLLQCCLFSSDLSWQSGSASHTHAIEMQAPDVSQRNSTSSSQT